MSRMNNFFTLMVERNASDMFFSADTPLHIKIDGRILPVGGDLLTASTVAKLAYSLMDEEQRRAFEERPELNLGRELEGLGRFRINIFRQRGQLAMVIRYLKDKIPSFEELNLPPVMADLSLKKRGLILLVGATGSGKTTTLAAMTDYRNTNSASHILTIEDPIEYVHRYKRSIVNQREVGLDTLSYADALKNAMREAPEVILIGEIRDRDTMQHALAYAETGHLCLSTLHATNANQALQRVISFFPESMYQQIFMDLAHNLTAIISQRLVVGREGHRLPAVEVLLATAYIRDLIQKGAVDEVRAAMEKNPESGMQTFDQSLFQLYRDGMITEIEALQHAESLSNLGVKIRLSKGAIPEFDRSRL